MSVERFIFLGLTIILIGLMFLSPAGLRRIGNFLSFGGIKTEKISPEEMASKVADLRAGENRDIEKLVGADVFSEYPFNLKNELWVNAGTNADVKNGGAAIIDGILIGRVKEVKNDSSVVQTIFDPNFTLPVRIGKSATNALLRGGVEPKITLIGKGSSAEAGDLVYSASPNLEYGILIGSIGPIIITQNGVFSEGNLVLSYNPADIHYIFLEK